MDLRGGSKGGGMVSVLYLLGMGIGYIFYI